jgi:serine/threonine protein kinase
MTGSIQEQTQPLSKEEIEADLKYHGFEIIRLLSSQGGMADVYEAWQPSVKRRIAAKRLKSHMVADADVRSRFEEEALLLGRLNHPHIVQVIDYSSEKLTLFMEFIEGKTLDEILVERRQISIEESLAICSAVLDALTYAHNRKIIHRDVKPGNIFLTDDGQIKLGDFGIAAMMGIDAADSSDSPDFWVGTPSYVSPEQLTGSQIDGRVDIYAVGITLYLLLSGRLPFVGENSTKTATMRLTHTPELPSKHNPLISQELDEIVMKALARTPEQRYQTAAEFRQALEVLRVPHRDVAYLQEARSELEKARQSTTTGRKRFLTSCVKLSQMALSENPENSQASLLLKEAQTELSKVRGREFALLSILATSFVIAIVVLSVLLSKGSGSLEIFTNEPADVYLDGSKIGTSPFVFKDIPAGAHKLLVEQPGFYKSPERQVRIEKGKVLSISEPIPDGGTIIVTSAQPGAQVLLDGTEIGITPLTRKIVVGKHLISVAGVTETILIHENESKTLSFGQK